MGDVKMSLVQTIITDDFVLMASETRGIFTDGKYATGVNKVIKLNDQIIFGCTGGSHDNYQLFNGFCSYSPDEGLLPIHTECNLTYSDFVEIITERFNKMYIAKHRSTNKIPYEIMSVICGYNKDHFEATMFNIDGKKKSDSVCKVLKAPNFPYKGINAGNMIHLSTLHELVEKTFFSYGHITLIQYKSILKEVFRKGAKVDNNINDDVYFEVIKKKDVM